MKLFNSIGVASAFVVSLFTATAVIAKDYMCAPYGSDTKIPCQVWVEGNKVLVGGFQAAPIFKMLSSWKAINHTGDTIKVMKGTNCTIPKSTPGST